MIDFFVRSSSFAFSWKLARAPQQPIGSKCKDAHTNLFLAQRVPERFAYVIIIPPNETLSLKNVIKYVVNYRHA